MLDIACSGARLYELMRDGRFLLATRCKLDLGRKDVTVAVHSDPTMPDAVLVRPDGYVAWAGPAAEAAAAVNQWIADSTHVRGQR